MSRPPAPTLYSTSPEALTANIRGEVREAMLELLPEAIRRARLGRYMTEHQASEETGLSKRQLRHLRQTNRISFIKRGQIVLFETAELLAYFDEGRVAARGD